MWQNPGKTLSLLCGIILPALMLAGCASPTPYKPLDQFGGYYETPLARNTWQVSVEGNTSSPPDYMERMALLRAAHLTLEQGFDKFTIIGGSGIARHSTLIGHTTGGFYPSAAAFGGRGFLIGGGLTYVPPEPIIDRGVAGNIIIRMFRQRDNFSEEARNAMDARSIIQSYEPGFFRPPN